MDSLPGVWTPLPQSCCGCSASLCYSVAIECGRNNENRNVSDTVDCLCPQVVIDHLPSATDAVGLAAAGVQLLRQAPPCGGSHAFSRHGRPLAGGAVEDLADRLGISSDGRLTLCNLPEGKHMLYLLRVGQVRLGNYRKRQAAIWHCQSQPAVASAASC